MDFAHAEPVGFDIGGDDEGGKALVLVGKTPSDLVDTLRERAARHHLVRVAGKVVHRRGKCGLIAVDGVKSGEVRANTATLLGDIIGKDDKTSDAAIPEQTLIAAEGHVFLTKTKSETVCPANVGAAIKIISDPCGHTNHPRQSIAPSCRIGRATLAQDIGIDPIYSSAAMRQRCHRLSMLVIQRHLLARGKGILRHSA